MPAATLVRSTLTGVRPLGVRGEPLHAAHEQIRGVVRRRLGERHARLLAEPQADEIGRRIDWYSEADGAVLPLSALAPETRTATLAEVDSLSRDITGLGDRLAETTSDDARLLARALALAVRRPSDDYVFLVGDQPVVVCWGYEAEAAGAIVTAPTLPAAAATTTVEPVVAPLAGVAAPMILRRGSIWPAALVGLLGILLILGTAYGLRRVLPVDPDVAFTQLPPPPAPPAPLPLPDPAIALDRDLGAAQTDGDRLKATLASLRDEFTTKRAACKPLDPPKPPPTPPVVEKKPDPPKPPPAKPPQVVEKKPDPPPPPKDDRLRLPKAPTTDMSFLKGCWRTDPFRHHSQQPSPGVSEYCFDASGHGSFVFRRGNMICRTAAQGRYEGTVLRLRDANTTCADGTTWYQDRLDCTVGADDVAVCRGEANSGPGGTLNRWSVSLHRVH